MEKTVAIIDLGSNSIRMNILSINKNGGYSIHEQASEMVRLSEDMGPEMTLKEIPIKRTITALHYFKSLIDANQTTEIYALATAAVRLAVNQADFLNRIQAETGFVFTVLSGFQEAYYDYLGVVNTLSLDQALILDIGGGSTEIIWMKHRQIMEAVSLPFGSVTLSERFKTIKSKKKRVEAAKKLISEKLHELKWLDGLKGQPIIGLGGVIRTLGKIDRSLNGYPIENLHNYRLHETEVDKLCALIIESDDKELDKIEGLSKRRSDIIAMGIMPFVCLFEHIQSPEIRISANGLRDGYFFEKHFTAIGQPVVVNDVLKHSKENFLKRFVVNEPHARNVQSLALTLYDALHRHSVENQLGLFEIADRKLLSAAALLHDIGIHIEYYDHHIHGFYLVANGNLNGLTNLERLSVAYLVGSHREAGIKNRMTDYESVISKTEVMRLNRLVVLLNLAEQLDRSERGLIKQLHLNILDSNFEIHAFTQGDASLEISSALRFADRFEKQFALKLTIIPK